MVDNNENFIYIFIIMLVLFFWLIISCGGCAPKLVDPIRFQKVEFEATEKFISADKIDKPDKPSPIFLGSDFKQVGQVKDAVYFAFTVSDFAKIVQLSKAFDAQDQVIKDYSVVIEADVVTINKLKEIIVLKETTIDYFSELYTNELNLRKQEEYQNKVDSMFYKVLVVVQNGVIIALSLI